jgi:hypothetical protein
MEEMVSADRDAVAVTADGDDVQFRPRHLDAHREGQGAPVNAVEAERLDVARQPRGTADPGQDDRIPGLELQLRHRAVERGQRAEIAAARAPDGL